MTKNRRILISVLLAALMTAIGIGVGYAQNVTFPGGSVYWGDYDGMANAPDRSVDWRNFSGAVNVPGAGVGVRWNSGGRGGVNINIPGIGFRTNIRW